MYQKEIIYLGLYKDGNRMGSAGFLKVENRNRESKCYLKVQNLPLGINGRFPIRVYSGTGWKELNGIAIQDGGGNWEDNLPENIDRAMIQVMLSGGYMLEGKSKSAVEMSGRKSADEPQDVDGSVKDDVVRDVGQPRNMADPESVNEIRDIENAGNGNKSVNMTNPRNVDTYGNMAGRESNDETRDIANLGNGNKSVNMTNPRNVDTYGNMAGRESIDETRGMISRGNADEPRNMMNPECTEKSRNTNNQIESNALWNTQEPENISNVREKEGLEQMQKDNDAIHNKDNTMNTYENRRELKSWNIGNSWRTQNQNNPTRARRVNTSNNQGGAERRNNSYIQNNGQPEHNATVQDDTGSQKAAGEYKSRQPQTIIITEELPRQVQTNTATATYNVPEYSVKEDKWEQILDTYENIHPYGDERVYVKLEPKDFVILQSKYQHLVNNSFLLHGFYNYRYVILGKEEDYYLGVPGVFYEREKMVALMFGFEAFECPGGTVRAGEFGYYLRKVEL